MRACFAEIFAYIYQEKVLTDWTAVGIFPLSQKSSGHHKTLSESFG
jgi:hypothetical protein